MRHMMHAAVLALAGLGTAAAAQDDGAGVTQPPVLTRPYDLDFQVTIPLRDGTELVGNIFRPRGDRPQPTVLLYTPYGADSYSDVAAYFARRGYNFASVNVRGRGGSDGELIPWTEDGRDGYDVIAWIADQPWSDGQVTMWGGSYAGKNQWMIAGEQPPALRTIVPASAGMVGWDIGIHSSNVHRPFNFYWVVMTGGATQNAVIAHDDAFWLGAYADLARGDIPLREFDALVGYPSAIWQDWMDHPAMDTFWEAATIAPENYAGITMPVLSIGAQFDGVGTVRFREDHLQHATPEAAAGSYLVIGPWNHPGTRNPRRHMGGLDLGAASRLDVRALHVQWWDHVMKDGPLPAFLRDHVVYYVLGADEWRSAPSVEAMTARRETWWLSSPDSTAGSIAAHGQLETAAPDAQADDRYVYDPSLPGYNEGYEGGALVSPDFMTDSGLMDRLDGDGLVYDSAPFQTATDIAGFPSAQLSLSMDVPDTDIRVALYEVKADGDVIFLSQDWVRARYRHDIHTAQPVTPGEPDVYRFENFQLIARTIQAGSVIRMVVVPLGAGIHVERNRNSGGIVAEETRADSRTATVNLQMGPAGSRLVIPYAAPRGEPVTPLLLADE